MVFSALIQRAGEALAEAAGADAKVILFGSHARGEGRLDSDVDFLVIEPEVKDRLEERRRLRRALGDIDIPIDIVVLEENLAARRGKVPGTMVYHALRDGRVLPVGVTREQNWLSAEGRKIARLRLSTR